MSQTLKPKLTVVKIGGKVIDSEALLTDFLDQFAKIEGYKVLVHGGGKIATDLAEQLGFPQTMIDGRRVTDAATLKIITMVYGGLINKNLVAKLDSRGVSALGVTGADGNLVRSRRRPPLNGVDYGFVGDVEAVNSEILEAWVKEKLVLVIAPLSHDGKGQILNTNADTIAGAVAGALSKNFDVNLVYSFEKSGVLENVDDENSVIREINPAYYAELKSQKKIFAGMIPKIDGAFRSIEQGVRQVVIGKSEQISLLLQGKAGTRFSND
jgi:acetylglutamate kinase